MMQTDQEDRRVLAEGDRVFTYGMGYEEYTGTLLRGMDQWYIHYDDGHECPVVDLNAVYKL